MSNHKFVCGKACVSVLSIGSCDTHELLTTKAGCLFLVVEMDRQNGRSDLPGNEHVEIECARPSFGLMSLSIW